MFENVWLSFFPDAKIGVVGVNGSGKSTLMKIIAGIDTEFAGEAKPAEGAKMGYLEQEPDLDEQLNVWGNVIAWCEEKKIVDRYNDVAAKLGEDYTDELMEEMTALQEKIDAGDLWDIDSRIEMAMDALRCPPDDWPVDNLSGGEKRRIAPGPAAAGQARHAAAGRADQPPRRRERRLAAAPPGELPRLRDPGHPRPATSSTRSPSGRSSSIARQGHPLRGQLLPAGWSRRPGSG